VRRTYPIEYEVARAALLQFRSLLDVSLPESETDVLAVLLANADALLSSEQSTVGVVVAAHGHGIAAGLAELANTLVGVNLVRWVELTLEQSPDELLSQVIHWVQVADQGGGVLLLVDFASLLSLGELVTRQTGVQVRTIANVSAPLVVEAVRRAQRSSDLTLEELGSSLTLPRSMDRVSKNQSSIWQETVSLRELSHEVTYKNGAGEAGFMLDKTPRVILSVCLTGFGSAARIAELIEEHLPGLREQGVEILCMDISLSSKTEADVRRLIGDRSVVAVVGTINPHLESFPYIALTDFLFGDGIARLRTLLGGTLIDPALLQPSREDSNGHAPVQEQKPVFAGRTPMFTQRADLMREISHTLSQRLLFLNPARAMPLIERMIELIEVEVGETFDIDVLAGLILHLAVFLERGIQLKGMPVSDTVRIQVGQQFPRELSICRSALQILSTQIARPLPDEEAYNIVGILRQVDIFSINPI
jgi:transcriptional regulatory protein LevR